MPELALYLKWRPQRFPEVIGQTHITQVLENSLKAGRIRHAYLFSGPRGTGKTTTARLLAKAINCIGENPPCGRCHACHAIQDGRYLDLIEIDAATHTGVDDVRELREKIVFAPSEGRYKVYIIDEVHRFTGNAFDALLKTLEEPPNHAVFVLATTEVERVPATIQSRCLHFAFRRVPLNEIFSQLTQIAEKEGYPFEDEALRLIAQEGNGSVRDSISLLDQLLTDPNQILTVDFVRHVIGVDNLESVHKVIEAIHRSDLVEGIRGIQNALEHGTDARQLSQQIVGQLRVMLLKDSGITPEDETIHITESWPKRRLIKAITAFSSAANQMRRSWQPQLDLELAFIKSIETEHQSPQKLTGRYEDPKSRFQASEKKKSTQSTGRITKTINRDDRGLLTVERVQQHWQELLDITSQYQSNIVQLLRQIEQIDVEINTIRLFTKPLFLEKWEDEGKKAALERGVQKLFGDGIEIEFVDSTDQMERAKANGGEINPLEDLIPVARELGAEVIDMERDTE